MRREEVEADERESEGIQEEEDGQDHHEEDSLNPYHHHHWRKETPAGIFKDCRTPPPARDRSSARPAHRQLDNLMDAKCFRINRLCRKASDTHDRFDLGVMGDLEDGERRALYPPWDVTSADIEHVLYRNHELPGCFYHWRDKKVHAGATSKEERKEKMRKVVEANMFDRVALITGWIYRLIGDRHAAGGMAVPPPVFSRPYQNLNDGHLAFGMCKKIRDTPFPFPYAQLMRFLLVMFCVSFPYVSTWAVPAQDNGQWAARALSFLVCSALFALNEVARELEVPFHVAHNDINIEELHDEFLSMLETLHTNFSKPTELGFHNDLREKVITPEHIFNRACSCAKCDAYDKEQLEKSGSKAQMVWNTTDTATSKEDRDLRELLKKKGFDFRGLDFHKLQALRLSKLQREERKETSPHDVDVDSELVCLQLAARVRDRIPLKWTQERRLQFIEDVDVWLLLEAKYGMRDRWRMKSNQGRKSKLLSPKSALKRRGAYSVRELRIDRAEDSSWAIAVGDRWEKHLDSMLKEFRHEDRSVIGSTLLAGVEERDPECELMYMWKRILEVKRGGDGTDETELTLEEQDCLDHASVFMSSRLTQSEHDAQACKNNIQLYREETVQAVLAERLYNESVIRIMKRIPDMDRRPLTADEEEKMDKLKLSVLESKEGDYKKFQQLKEIDPSTLSQMMKDAWHADLKRLEAPELNEEEQEDLNRLKREKYDRAFKGVGLKDLKRIATKKPEEMTDEENREYERRGVSDQEAYLVLLALLPRDELTEEQAKAYKMLRLIRFYRHKRNGEFNPTTALRTLPAILQRKEEPDELTQEEQEWKEYQDLQIEELHQRSESGTGEPLTAEEKQEFGELSVSILQRKKREDLTLEDVETLYTTLKAQLSEDKRDEELLEWLDMRRNQLKLFRLKEKAQTAGTAEKDLEKDSHFLEQQIRYEQANIKVLERYQFDKDFSEKKLLEELKAKQQGRAQAKNEKNMKQIVADGLQLIEATKDVASKPPSPTDAKFFDQIQEIIQKLQVKELVGMRTDTEEDLLDKLYVRQLEWKLMQDAELIDTPLDDLSEDEESLQRRTDELKRERERTTYELERRQRTILEREKAQAGRALKEAVKEVEEYQKDVREESAIDASAGQIDSGGGDDDAAQEGGQTPEAAADVSQIKLDMEKATQDVESKRAEVDRIDAQLDQLLLKDLERRKEKGLLDSEEEHALDVQIKRCLKRQLEEVGKLDPEVMQKYLSAELRLLERKAGKQTLDDDERHELDLRTFHALFTKKSSGSGLTASDNQKLEKVIVAIYTDRKKFAMKQAQEALQEEGGGGGAVGEGKQKVVPNENMWSSDEDLDLKRYELKLLMRQKDGGSLSVSDLERVYNLRCEMIDGLTERIESRAQQLDQRAASGGADLEPEPEPEPELDSEIRTPRVAPSVSFSLRVTDDAGDEDEVSSGANDSSSTSSVADAQLPDLRLALTPRAEAIEARAARAGGIIAEDEEQGGEEPIFHPLTMGQKLPSGLFMLPSSPIEEMDHLAMPSPASSSFAHSLAADVETPAGAASGLGGGYGGLNVGDSINMSAVGSMMVSPKIQESQLEEGVVGQRLLSTRLSPGACMHVHCTVCMRLYQVDRQS